MIGLDRIIRVVREGLGHKRDWPDLVRSIRDRITEMKLGFPGLSNDDLSIIRGELIKEGDIFIHDPYLLSSSRGDRAPVMYRVLPGNRFYVEGIGCGLDEDDPDRINIRWRDEVDSFSLPEYVIRVDCRPSLNGGPGYYYFFKSYRDQRK